ncbi:hypothetical protein BD410DRAFT_241252 [Rickenella mellea]|uniref:Uncharacterized protein n=1 Tax=Rickenella mellea TaxID=50990 RepID=A0A4Y7QM51_9AGAM|nr:hypothetical protein BD410DRAFT_241252 [Rickenella mellea]
MAVRPKWVEKFLHTRISSLAFWSRFSAKSNSFSESNSLEFSSRGKANARSISRSNSGYHNAYHTARRTAVTTIVTYGLFTRCMPLRVDGGICWYRLSQIVGFVPPNFLCRIPSQTNKTFRHSADLHVFSMPYCFQKPQILVTPRTSLALPRDSMSKRSGIFITDP